MSNLVLGALWLWFTVQGYLAMRRRHLSEHRHHMVRSATLALSVITNRVLDADHLYRVSSVAAQCF